MHTHILSQFQNRLRAMCNAGKNSPILVFRFRTAFSPFTTKVTRKMHETNNSVVSGLRFHATLYGDKNSAPERRLMLGGGGFGFRVGERYLSPDAQWMAHADTLHSSLVVESGVYQSVGTLLTKVNEYLRQSKSAINVLVVKIWLDPLPSTMEQARLHFPRKRSSSCPVREFREQTAHGGGAGGLLGVCRSRGVGAAADRSDRHVEPPVSVFELSREQK